MNHQTGAVIQRIHFIGIGGVAMAQVAAWLKRSGRQVTGSDQGIYPPMSDFLRTTGIQIFTPYAAANLAGADLVVVGNALSRGNPEVEATLDQRLPYVSLPDLIGSQVLTDKLPMVVAGTHGKTTVTAALTHVLRQSGVEPGYLIGGMPIGFESGFDGGKGRFFVIEGDEYDCAFFDKRPKFLHYRPQAVVLNCIEFDHADIYTSIDDIYLQFRRLIQLIPQSGCLLFNSDAENLEPLIEMARCPAISWGRGPTAQVRGELIELNPMGMEFKLRFASGAERRVRTTLWGDHQLANLIAAAAAAEWAGVSADQITAALATFRGVKRRLELRFSDGKRWLYEDFAHHPTAVSAALLSLRQRHPNALLIAAFEPRSNTVVRRFFQKELGAALGLADQIYLGAIYRQEKIPPADRLDATLLIEQLRSRGQIAHYEEDVDHIANAIMTNLPEPAVIVVLSNGAFSGLIDKLLSRL